MRFLLIPLLGMLGWQAAAQQADTTIVEEDFSMYADAELADGAKRFCTSKVFDLSPNKLISIGYDFQAGYNMDFGQISGGQSMGNQAQQIQNRFNQGLRVGVNAPVISQTNVLLNVGFTYWDHLYSLEGSPTNSLARSLQQYGLRTTGVNFTLFKPLNEKQFIIFFGSADYNGNYGWNDLPSLRYTKLSATGIYGWKKHDRLMYGFGISRTYRIGEMNYIPVMMYNYTFPSRKWGVEGLFPARANVRRTFNARTLGFFGYELEGASYLITNRGGEFDPALDNLELRRSELRVRFTFERSLKDFIWISAQAGLRYNWMFNVDSTEFFRGFGDDAYFITNSIGNPLYFNVSINLVSP
jgi:hypothetical protein